MLCRLCFDYTSKKISKIPPLSLKNNVDFSLLHLYRRPLTLLERLMCSEYQMFHYALKIGGNIGLKHVGSRGHVICLETNAFDITTKVLEKMINDER